MPYRYLATLDPDGHADDDATTPENCGLVSGGPGAMRLFASADTPTLLTPDGGILVGRLFGADGTPVRRTTDLPMIVSPAQFRRFVLERCWGEYVLFQAEATAAPAITITRDPSGGVACVCSLEHAPRFVTSDISLATQHGLYRKRIDWDYIAHCLLYPHMVSQRAGLAGIRELLPGCLIRVTGMAWDSEPVWSPWDFVGAPARTRDSAEAATRVRHCVRMATKAWAGIDGRVLLELSGGLDSSILAACLRDTGADVSCATLVTPVPGADERQYASLMADSLGVPLRVEELDFALARFDAPPPAWSVGPRINVLQRALNEAMSAVGASEDVASHFSGGGGDTVFCYLGNAAPAADAFRERGFSAGIGVVRDLSRLHQCTFWKAARLTLDKLARAPRAMQSPDSTLLHPRVAARPHDAHPWFDEPPETLPGDLQRIRLLAATHLYRHAMWRGPLRELRMPLLSQPVVEACLRAPTWMWVADGRNRSVARAAFAHDLPRPILQRRSKGDFAQYLGAVWRRRQHDMQQFLLEGELQAEGLLDADALREFCARPELPRDESFNRIFELCTIENWLRHQR